VTVGRFSHHAMATVFEVALAHDDPVYAEQCAHEAFREVDRLERALSRYIENSDIARVNDAAVGERVRVGVDAFECIKRCVDLCEETNGACDVTLGTGIDQLELDDGELTVTRRSSAVAIDLGGYGKGYAVDCMAKVLDDWEIESAMLHGGTSSVLARGAPPGERGWLVTLRHPSDREQVIGRFCLRHLAVNGSGLRKGCHIIDPRTGETAAATSAAWAITSDAAAGDALSTAFMIMSPDEIGEYCAREPGVRAIVIRGDSAASGAVVRFGDCRDLERP